MAGGDLAARDVGDAEAPAVLLVHGFPTSSYLWRAFAPALVPAMRAIAPDLLGAGESDAPPESALDPSAQAAGLIELLGELGVDRVAVVGHGHGGLIAQLLATQGRADALVLVDSVAPGEPPAPMRELLSAAADPAVGVADLLSGAFERGMERRERLDVAAFAEYRRPYEVAGGRDRLARLAAALGVAPPELRVDDLRDLDVPVLLAWGEDDALVPPEVAERLNDAMPRSALALLPGCGHFLPEEAPATLAPLVYEYLRGAYARMPHVHDSGPTAIELGRRYTKE